VLVVQVETTLGELQVVTRYLALLPLQAVGMEPTEVLVMKTEVQEVLAAVRHLIIAAQLEQAAQVTHRLQTHHKEITVVEQHLPQINLLPLVVVAQERLALQILVATEAMVAQEQRLP
jgi:hypothetical protein